MGLDEIAASPEIPTPTRILSMGPPKHADSAIIGNPILAIVVFEIRSPSELPIAKTVRPMIASEIWKMIPSAFSTPTTSLAISDTHEMAIKNPTNANDCMYTGARYGSSLI